MNNIMNNIKKPIYIFIVVITIALFFVFINDSENLTVPNNIQEVDKARLLAIAAEMNAPGWDDILIEAAEWVAVGVVATASAGWLTSIVAPIKASRNINKAKNVANATNESYILLNKVIKPFYKASARPFKKSAIDLIPKKHGVYLFFNKHGKVKYVGKATNLRLRLNQHLVGPANSGNLYLSQNSKSLSFVAIPIKAIGNNSGAIKCVEAILIKAFASEELKNKRIESINKNDCRQLVWR